MAQIEAVRVVQDAAYAASLSDQDWYALSQDPAWQEMVSEQSEMVAGVEVVRLTVSAPSPVSIASSATPVVGTVSWSAPSVITYLPAETVRTTWFASPGPEL